MCNSQIPHLGQFQKNNCQSHKLCKIRRLLFLIFFCYRFPSLSIPGHFSTSLELLGLLLALVQVLLEKSPVGPHAALKHPPASALVGGAGNSPGFGLCGSQCSPQCSLEIFTFFDSVHLSTLTAWIKSMKTEKRHGSCCISVGHLAYHLGPASLSPP